jgi:hypothetical protein
MREVTVKRSEWLRGNNRAIRNRLWGEYGHALSEELAIQTTLCETFHAKESDEKIAVTGRCCLGFWANSLGFSDKELLEHSTPLDLAGYRCPTYTELQTLTAKDKELLDSLDDYDGEPVRAWDHFDSDCAPNGNFTEMMRINDDPTIDDIDREAQLIDLGALEDIVFTFID